MFFALSFSKDNVLAKTNLIRYDIANNKEISKSAAKWNCYLVSHDNIIAPPQASVSLQWVKT